MFAARFLCLGLASLAMAAPVTNKIDPRWTCEQYKAWYDITVATCGEIWAKGEAEAAVNAAVSFISLSPEISQYFGSDSIVKDL